MLRPLILLLLIIGLAIPGYAFSYPLDVFEAYAEGESGVSRTNEVVSFGFPFPDGMLSSLNSLKVKGASVYQFKELGRWPSGSMKWVLVDFVVPSLSAGQIDKTTFAIEDGGSGNTGGSDLCVLSGDTITASTTGTGGAVFKLKKNNFNVFDEVTLNTGTQVVVSGNQGEILFLDDTGTGFSSRSTNATRFEIKDNGPARCQVVVEGMLGTSNLGYRAIYDFYRGKSHVNVTASIKNALFNSNSHKLTRGVRVIVDTTLEGSGISGDAPTSSGSLASFSLGSNETAVMSNWDSTNVDAVDEDVAGFQNNPGGGYAVELVPNGGGSAAIIVPRTSENAVPIFQWLKVSQGSKNVRVTGRDAAYFFPNGAQANGADGKISYDIFTPTYPIQPMPPIPYRMYVTREMEFDFDAASTSSYNGARRYTHKLIFVPGDRTHYGNAGGFYIGKVFENTSSTELQSFYDRSDVESQLGSSFNVCTTPTTIGGKLLVQRAIPPSLTGGGISNNSNANQAYMTFTAGAREVFPTVERLARHRADFQDYLDDKTFTYPKTTTQANDFDKGATNTDQMVTLFGKWNVALSDEAHDWSFQTNLDFYHYTGREEFRRGMEQVYLRSWLGKYNFPHYVRPMGMELQKLAHALQFLQETNHPSMNNHKQYVIDFLTKGSSESGTSGVLYNASTPDYGSFTWETTSCPLAGVCSSYHINNDGWFAPPGEKLNVTGLVPEIQSFDFGVDTGYSTTQGSDHPTGCQDGQRYWMMGQRFGLGLLETYESLASVDPSNDVVLEPLRKRVIDIAKYLSGNRVGRGAYKHNFSNPGSAFGYYVYCVMNSEKNVEGQNGAKNSYLISYLYSFAAQYASTQSEKEWWQHMAMNELFAHQLDANPDDKLTCDREFDPRAQWSIKEFMSSGTTYTPANYSNDTPFPDPSSTFGLNTVIPSTITKGFDTLLTVNGTLFTSTDTVEIGIPAQLMITPVFVNASKLTFTLTGAQSTALGAGTFPLRVKQGSTYSNSTNLTIQVVTPILSSISPSAINNGASGQLFSLTGSNFQNGAQVKVGSLALQNTTYVSSTQLTFTLSGSQITTLGLGTFDVYVQNPDGGQSGVVSLSILPVGSPVLDSYSPIDVEWNTGPTTISLMGSAFQSGAQATLLNIITPTTYKAFSTTFVNSRLITFPLTLNDTLQLGPGIYSVLVKNPDNKLSNTLPNFVIYIPYITGQSYSSIPIDQDAVLTLTGYYFKAGALGKIGNVAYTPSSISPTSLAIPFTTAQLQSLGVGDHTLTIQNPAGGLSNPITFTLTETGDPEPGDTTPSQDTGSSGGAGGGGGGGGSGGSGGGGGGSGGSFTCTPVLELCNGVDDDCDNDVDEGCETLTNTCQNGLKDEGELGVDCGGVCANFCLQSIPDSTSLLFFAALNPIIVLIQALLRLLGL